MDNDNLCIVSSTSERSVRKVLKFLKDKKFKWVYFGEDPSRPILIQKIVSCRGTRQEITEMLQQNAKLLRQPYIDYIGNLSQKNNSLLWWAGSLSEKNPFKSKTFLNSCYLKTFKDILKKNQNGITVFFVEKRTLRKAIIKNAQHIRAILIENKFENLTNEIKAIKRFVLLKTWFLLGNFYRMVISKYKYPAPRDISNSLFLIFTWIDTHSFSEAGKYRDVYLGDVPEKLKKYGKKIALVPYYIISNLPYGQTVKKMRESSEYSFLIPHAFLSFWDVLYTFFFVLANFPKKAGWPKFEDMDITDLIYEDLMNDWSGIHMCYDFVLYRFIKRLKEKKFHVKKVIYPYENLSWEKMMITAMRRYYPSSQLIGYQHSTVPLMSLNHFFSKIELNIIPLPNRIITNGRYTRKLFIQSGYPKERIVEGGAVRYKYLLSGKKGLKKIKHEAPIVLVTTSISEFDASGLILKVLEAFGDKKGYRILIKCHPDTPYEKISSILKIKLPNHFIISNRPVSELLAESDVLIYTCATTSIEAIATGVPIVHVRSDLSIDLDQLDFDPKLRPSVYNPKDLVEYVDEIITMDKKELSKKRKKWQRVVENLFGRINNRFYRLFLDC